MAHLTATAVAVYFFLVIWYFDATEQGYALVIMAIAVPLVVTLWLADGERKHLREQDEKLDKILARMPLLPSDDQPLGLSYIIRFDREIYDAKIHRSDCRYAERRNLSAKTTRWSPWYTTLAEAEHATRLEGYPVQHCRRCIG